MMVLEITLQAKKCAKTELQQCWNSTIVQRGIVTVEPKEAI